MLQENVSVISYHIIFERRKDLAEVGTGRGEGRITAQGPLNPWSRSEKLNDDQSREGQHSLTTAQLESKTVARVERRTLEDKLHNKHHSFADQQDLAASLVALAPDTSLQAVSPWEGRQLTFLCRPVPTRTLAVLRDQLTSFFHLALLASYPVFKIYSSSQVILAVYNNPGNVISQNKVVDFSVMELELCRTASTSLAPEDKVHAEPASKPER